MEYRTGGKARVLDFKENKIPAEITAMQTECFKLYSGFQNSVDELGHSFKLILQNCQEDEIRMYFSQGYQKELGWILEIIQSYKRLHQTLEAEKKLMEKILKTARKGR
jgi:hypothetical protein